MTQYLLSVVQPVGPTPPAETLGEMAERLDALNRDLQKAGSWVFSGGLHQPGLRPVAAVVGQPGHVDPERLGPRDDRVEVDSR